MENPKLLVTAGCSFSQTPPDRNWPIHLENYLGCRSLHLGQGAAGNQFISRKLLHHLNKQLKNIDGKDILVGVMWSGITRQNFYFENISIDHAKIFTGMPNHNYMIPAALEIYSTNIKNYFADMVWTDELSKIYFKNFYDMFNCVLNSLENILRVQLFCEKYNIRYFFTNYSLDTVPTSFEELKSGYPNSYQDAEHLYEQIDWSKWLPVREAWKWIIEESGYPEDKSLGNHPTSEQSKAFTDRIIIPHIKKLGYV